MSTVRLAYNPGPVNAYGAFKRTGGGVDVRLAFHPEGDRTLSEINKRTAPSGRLALVNSPAERNGTLDGPVLRLAVAPHAEKGGANSVQHHVNEGGLGVPVVRRAAQQASDAQIKRSGISGPVVRLAHTDEAQGTNCLQGTRGVKKLPQLSAPALLVSYVYLEPFLKNQSRYCYRDWALDSGAFSAHQSGTKIDLQAYIEKAKELLANDPTLVEVFALDVIGDWRASLKNTEEMWRQGVEAIPCWHIGEPESALLGMAKDYPKIALGGVAKAKGGVKMEIARQVFARVWPKKVHGFGYGTEEQVLAFPWHSVDATNWEIGPCAFGRWAKYGKMSVRGSKQNLRVEVEHYLDLEQRARIKWRKQMEELERTSGRQYVWPTIRLADNTSGRNRYWDKGGANT